MFDSPEQNKLHVNSLFVKMPTSLNIGCATAVPNQIKSIEFDTGTATTRYTNQT